MLTDWTDEDPQRVFAKLKKQSDYYNFRQRTIGDFIDDVQRDGFWPTLSARSAWGRMRMSDRDLADVTGATYTYLMNGQPPASGWTGLFRPGERVRLRLINGSAMTYFDVRLPGLNSPSSRPTACRSGRWRWTSFGSPSLKPTTSSSSRRRGRVHDLRAGDGPHGLRGRYAGGRARVCEPPCRTSILAPALDGRHGSRRAAGPTASRAAAGHALPRATSIRMRVTACRPRHGHASGDRARQSARGHAGRQPDVAARGGWHRSS